VGVERKLKQKSASGHIRRCQNAGECVCVCVCMCML